MNENPQAVTYITAGIILLALVLIIWQLVGGHSTAVEGVVGGSNPNQNFFTTDDGKTWFPDDNTNIPPYTKDGKPAYQVMLFSCDGGKTSFVGYLQRYSVAGKKEIEKHTSKGMPPGAGMGPTYLEFKAADNGDIPKNWAKFGTQQAQKLQTVACPGGGEAEPVTP